MNGNIDQAHEQMKPLQGISQPGMLQKAFGSTAAAGSARRQQRRDAGMWAKRLAAGAALLGTVVASLAGLSGTASGTPHVAFADSSIPAITMAEITADPLSVEAFGVDFSPGRAVHIDLEVAFWGYVPTPTPDGSGDPTATPVPFPTQSPNRDYLGEPQIVASVDTAAARTIYIHNGHGIIFRRAGGYFDVTLTLPSNPCGGYFDYWLVATDEATGTTSTSDRATGVFTCN